jgi:hypothetical protein
MPAATRGAVHQATNLLTAIPDAAALGVACALADDPKALLRLALVCKRYSAKSIAGARGGAAAVAEMWSIVNEAARLSVQALPQDEQAKAPRRGKEPWLGVLNELQALAAPLAFTHYDPRCVRVNDRDAVHNRCAEIDEEGRFIPSKGRLAVCSLYKMRAGVHYAEIVLSDEDIHCRLFGFSRCGGSGGSTSAGVFEHGVFYGIDPASGKISGSYDNYEGENVEVAVSFPGGEAFKPGDTMGMRMDMDRGCVTVYKNSRRLGLAFIELNELFHGEHLCFTVALFSSLSASVGLEINLRTPPELSAEEHSKEAKERPKVACGMYTYG